MTKALLFLLLLLISCSVAASTTAGVQYPMAWAFDSTILGQIRSAGASIEAQEILADVQRQVQKKTFNPTFGGGAKPPGRYTKEEWTRYRTDSGSVAITFTIDHPVTKDNLKPGFGVREILSFYNDGQWVFYRDNKLLIRGWVQPTNE